jgi:hypothetical protein
MRKLVLVFSVVLVALAACTGGNQGGISSNSTDFDSLAFVNYTSYKNPNKPTVAQVSVKDMWEYLVAQYGGAVNDPHIVNDIISVDAIKTPANSGKSYIYYLEADTVDAKYGTFTELVATTMDIESTIGNLTVNGDLNATGSIVSGTDITSGTTLNATTDLNVGGNSTFTGTGNFAGNFTAQSAFRAMGAATFGSTVAVTGNVTASADLGVNGVITAASASESSIANLFVTNLRATNIDGYAKDEHFGTVSPYETVTVPYISATNLVADDAEVNILSVLNVTGDIEAAQDINIQGSIHSYSDRKFKRNVNAAPSLLVQLCKLQIVTYDFLNPTTHKSEPQIGVVAQDVAKLGYPYNLIVSQGKKGLVIDYSRLSVFAIKAAQELYKDNKALTDKVDKLEHRLALLEKAINK